MEKNIEVSIIIPIYNVETYLEDCLESVFNQSFQRYEVILVDDGSTDKSIIIEERYLKNKDNIRLIKQKNKGSSDARNAGLKIANGKYIYFMDSDDIIHKTLLKKCYEVSEKNKLDILFFGVYIKNDVDGNNYTYTNNAVNEEDIVTGREYLINTVKQQRLDVSVSIQFIRRDFLIKNKIIFGSGLIHQDTKYTIDILLKAERVMNIKDVFYTYIIRKNSITRTPNFNKIESDIAIIKYFFITIKEKYMKDIRLKDNFKKFIWQTIFEIVLWDYRQICKYVTRKNLIDKINIFIEEFLNIFGKDIKENDAYYICSFIHEINSINEANLSSYTYIIADDLNRAVADIMKKSLKLTKRIKNNMLSKVGFNNENNTIAIYGIGKHTDSLLKFYNCEFGEIKSKLIFLDSFKGTMGEKYKNCNIINIKDVNNYNIDSVVISSAAYEKQLYDNILKNTNKITDIYRFYDEYRYGILFD